MFTAALNKRIQLLVVSCVLLMTLVVTPWMNLDPINLPKFLILAVCGFAILGNLLPYLGRIVVSEMRVLLLAGLGFVVALVLAFVFGGSGSFAQVYGSYGRNTGLLSYMSLVLILVGVVTVTNLSFARKLLWVLIFTGAFNAVYGMFQWAGMDPVDWNNPYDPIVGTLGNPNFTSAHLGIAGLASLALLFEVGMGLRVLLAGNILLSLFVIYQSDSSQGSLVFGLGATLVFYFKFVRGLGVIKYLYWLVVAMGSGLGVFGILNKGPLAGILYQESVTYRGDYWRAGWKMTLENPVFGVGLDKYGDWYRFTRNEAAALRRGPDVVSNSAHNVFLDISSNGGFLMLIAYLVIVGLVIRSAFRLLLRSKGFDGVGVGLVAAWLAYLVQSIISINQLGLAIWGWVLGGAIIGYDHYKDRPDAPRVRVGNGKRPEQVPAKVVVTGALGLVVGVLLSIWPVARDASFRTSLQSGDATKIEESANGFPQSTYYYVYSAQILFDNKLEDKALDMARKAIALNPRDFNGWKALVANPNISAEEKASAIAEMKKLDPFNNTLGD